MAIRLKDAMCSVCGKQWEDIVIMDEPWNPRHCGKPAKKIILAPAVKFVEPHFNRGLGMHIRDSRHLDKELAKRNMYIPTKVDVARSIERAPGDEPVPDDPRIGQIAEKVYSDLHNEGKI